MEKVYGNPGFENKILPEYVYKLNKALYGFKQAPRAWHERLSKFLVDNVFDMEKVDTILFIKRKCKDSLIIQIYVDDLVFGATNESVCEEFANMMKRNLKLA